MRPAGVSLEHEDRLRSYSDVEAAPDPARDGLHRRPTHTVSVDLDRLSVSAGAREAGPLALETDELEGVPPAGRPNGPGPRSLDPQFIQRAPGPGTAGRRGVSPQPQPNPIAVEVAERYAKALTLGATAPLPPEPRTPRRSRAAMRDRALGPGAAEATQAPRSRPAAPTPAPRSRPAPSAPSLPPRHPGPAEDLGRRRLRPAGQRPAHGDDSRSRRRARLRLGHLRLEPASVPARARAAWIQARPGGAVGGLPGPAARARGGDQRARRRACPRGPLTPGGLHNPVRRRLTGKRETRSAIADRPR